MSNNERKLDIGCGPEIAEGYEGMDRVAFEGVQHVHDIEDVPWPFDNESFDVVRASHVLEHMRDLINVMNEIQRVLKPGGVLKIIVPLAMDAQGNWHGEAFQDPTHVRFFVPDTFTYFCGRQETIMYGIKRWELCTYSEKGYEAHVLLRKPDDAS
ncbi:MAG: methyltransferase domain-containing protein [Anaerolineae bacterium]